MVSGPDNAVTYRNRKGVRFTLCRVQRQSGAMSYVFCREPRGEPVDRIPEGYAISESVNGVVSLRKPRPIFLTREEVDNVRDLLARRNQMLGLTMAVEGRVITVYEPSHASLQPMLRFELSDEVKRTFTVQRMIFRGHARWSYVLDLGPLSKIAPRPVSALGTEAFYDLI